MKRLLLSIVIVTSFAACNNNDKTDTTQRNIQLLRDSTAFTNSNIYSDTMADISVQEPVLEKPVTTDVTPKKAPKKVFREPAKSQNTAPVYVEKKQEKVEATMATPPINSGNGQNREVGNTTGNTPGNAGATVPQVEQKKGWNKATTGAVIGGAAGAAGGAIISKKKGVGAVVGAVVGAASGYIIGKDMDKKDKKK